MKVKSNKELVKLYYEELWNEHNKEYVDILFSDDITFRGSFGVNTQGKEEFIKYMDSVLDGMPDMYHTVEYIVSENNYAAARANYRGTHVNRLFEFEPTHERVKFNGASFFKFNNGKIVDIWVLGDLINLHKQL